MEHTDLENHSLRPPSVPVTLLVLSLVSLSAMCNLGGWSPGSVSGVVVDRLGAAPRQPVQIVLTSLATNSPAHTGFARHNGAFVLDGVRPGEYRLEVWSEGTSNASIRIDYDGTDLELDPIPIDSRRGQAASTSTDSGRGQAPSTSTTSTVDWRELKVPRKAERAFLRGVLELNRNQLPERSIRHFEKAIQLFPEYCAAYLQISVAHFETGKFDLALEALDKLLSICDRSAQALALKGKVLLKLGQLGSAIQELARSVALDDEIWNAHVDLTEALTRSGRVAEAQKHAEKAHLLQPENPASHVSLYRVLARLGLYAQALAELDEIIRQFGGTAFAEEVQEERQRLLKFLAP